MIRKIAAGLAVLGMLFAFADTVPAAEEEKVYGSEVGTYLKEFKLKEPVEKKEYALNDFAKTGKDTAIIFMQTACSLCVSEIQEFLDAREDVENNLGVALVSVDFDEKRIAPYKAAYSIPFPILHDPDAAVMSSVKFNSTPAIVVVDAKGKIQVKKTGYDKAEMKALLKKYMK